jgi:lysophospholipase L1-like esterase
MRFGGRTVAWVDEHLGDWLKKLIPKAAVILIGTNDLPGTSADEYHKRLRSVIQRCCDNGTVVLLTTIPPRHGLEKKAAEFAATARELASELTLPLIDYHAEIMKRRPDDWDGTSDQFKQFKDYDVPTLLARDGVHPSFPKAYQNDYSDAGLSRSGYTLRNYLTATKYAEVLEAPAVKPTR